MGQPYAPQQLEIVEAVHGVHGGLYKVVLTTTHHLVVCSHTTWLAAWKCKHGDCTKGHNFNGRDTTDREHDTYSLGPVLDGDGLS
jgi:hypothetical protein